MLGLLRIALNAARLSMPKLPANIMQSRVTSIPFVPMDWVFRWFPYFTRDKVRFMLRFNQVSFLMGFGYMYVISHPPGLGAHYGHEWKSPLYNYTKERLDRTGQYDENVRVKVHHFYPVEE